MKKILSIQSHVAFGYVGNRAAVFPLQRLGCEVIVVNTVQFSNHTGYGHWRGDIFSPDHIKEVLQGIQERGELDGLDAIISGYLGDASLGNLILETLESLRLKNPKVIYCCDPVIGDVGRGIFVRPGIPEFFMEKAVPMANIVTPNHFELDYLTHTTTQTLDDVLKACIQLRQRGPQCVLVTSVRHDKTPADALEVVVSTAEGAWRVVAQRLPMDPQPNGAGDAIAAIFLAKYLETKRADQALLHATCALDAIFTKTHALNRRELALIHVQDEIVNPTKQYHVESIG